MANSSPHPSPIMNILPWSDVGPQVGISGYMISLLACRSPPISMHAWMQKQHRSRICANMRAQHVLGMGERMGDGANGERKTQTSSSHNKQQKRAHGKTRTIKCSSPTMPISTHHLPPCIDVYTVCVCWAYLWEPTSTSALTSYSQQALKKQNGQLIPPPSWNILPWSDVGPQVGISRYAYGFCDLN